MPKSDYEHVDGTIAKRTFICAGCIESYKVLDEAKVLEFAKWDGDSPIHCAGKDCKTPDKHINKGDKFAHISSVYLAVKHEGKILSDFTAKIADEVSRLGIIG